MKFFHLSLIFLILAFAQGCKSEKAKVTGHVTFQGNPIENGKISFDSADGNSQGASTEIVDGDYELTIHKLNGSASMIVRIWGFKKTGIKIKAPAGSPGITSEGELLDETQMYIPAQYNSSSKQTVRVESGKENVFDFELKSAVKGKSR